MTTARGKKPQSKLQISVIWADLESVPLKQQPTSYSRLLDRLSALYGVPKTSLKLTYTGSDGDKTLIFDERSFENAREEALVSKQLTIVATEEAKSGHLDLMESSQTIPIHSALGPLASFYIDHQADMHPSVRSLFRKVLKGNANDLSKLDLREGDIGPENVRMLAMTLPYILNLEHLYLKQNAIGGSGTQYLVDGLEMLTQKKTSDDEMAAHRPLLSELCIENNALGVVGGCALGAALRHLQGLLVLKLDENRIGDEGIRAIAKCLPQVMNLQNLGLDGNEISDEGLDSLGKAVNRLRKLHVLWIERNRIGNSGAETLATKLPHSLRFIWIGGNPLLEAEGLSTLRKILGSICQVFA